MIDVRSAVSKYLPTNLPQKRHWNCFQDADLCLFTFSWGVRAKEDKGGEGEPCPGSLLGFWGCRGGSFFLVMWNLRVRILLTLYNQNGGFHSILCTDGSPGQLTSCSLFKIKIRGSTTFYELMDHHDSWHVAHCSTASITFSSFIFFGWRRLWNEHSWEMGVTSGEICSPPAHWSKLCPTATTILFCPLGIHCQLREPDKAFEGCWLGWSS